MGNTLNGGDTPPQLESHPLPLLDQFGIQVTINTDDPRLVGTTLSRECDSDRAECVYCLLCRPHLTFFDIYRSIV